MKPSAEPTGIAMLSTEYTRPRLSARKQSASSAGAIAT